MKKEKETKKKSETLEALCEEAIEEVLPRMKCNVEAWHYQKDWCKRTRAALNERKDTRYETFLKYWLRFWIIIFFIPSYIWRVMIFENASLDIYKVFWNIHKGWEDENRNENHTK